MGRVFILRLPEPVRNVLRHRIRTGLTVLGITIGIFALVMLGALAEKVNILVAGGEKYLSDRVAVIAKGAGHPFFGSQGLVPASLAGELARMPEVACVEKDISMLLDPDSRAQFGMPKVLSGIDVEERLRCDQVAPGPVKVDFASGGWWQPGQQRVAVLGVDVANYLGVRTGDEVEVDGITFRVVGTLNRTLTGPDNIFYVPLEDAREILLKRQPWLAAANVNDTVLNIWVVLKKGVDGDILAQEIPSRFTDVDALGPSELQQPLRTSNRIFQFTILGVAMVALIVGGLSIINTMVMSVAERVREIGIKKAVGAADSDILWEYLTEAAFIGLMGGLIGLGLGQVGVRVLNHFAQEAAGAPIFLVTMRLALGSVAFAAGLGAAAGIFPALRAARLRPVEALRAE
jgi:putative ABC transport system permease protein